MDPRIMIIGGDNTSDRFGAALASIIHKKCPRATLYGVGGPIMNDAGARLLFDISGMVSLGVFQSIKGSAVVKRLIKRVVETMDQEEPSLVLQIGLPVFGFKIIEIAKSRGIPVLYYYTPLSRGLANVNLGKFASVIDRVAGISLTETALCKEAGISVEFVGHPLNDLLDHSFTKRQARENLGIDTNQGKVIAILPGAREVEVKNVLPTVLKALDQVLKENYDVQIIISVASTIRTSVIEDILKKSPHGRVKMEQDASCALLAADLAITSIGTSSLEASLLGVPSLAVYRVPSTTYFAEKLLNRKPYMTITNKILRKHVIPEFIQGDFNHSKIAETIGQLLCNEEARQAMIAKFSQLEHELGEPGSVKRAAEVVLEMAGCGDHGTTGS